MLAPCPPWSPEGVVPDLSEAPQVSRTERLLLQSSEPAFAAAFADAVAASSSDLAFVAGWRDAADIDVARRSLERSIELADVDVVRHAFTHGGRYVGRFDLHSWDHEVPRCELGYLVDSRLTGQGLATEAAAAMLDIAWQLGAIRVQAMCDVRNVRGIALAERIGMRREGVLRSYSVDHEKQPYDELVLARLSTDD